MKHIKTYSRHLVFFLIVISFVTLSVSAAEMNSYSYDSRNSNLLDDLSRSVSSASELINGVTWPISSALSYQTSTQTQSLEGSGQTTGGSTGSGTSSGGGIITENRLYLAKGEQSQHLIKFDNYGQITAQAQEGVTFDLYSQKGAGWPDSNSFRTDYTQKMQVGSQDPVVMNVGPGTWIFTFDAPQEGGRYVMTATQNARQDQQSVSRSSSYSYKSVTLAEPYPQNLTNETG